MDLKSKPSENEREDKSLTDHSLSGFSWLAGRTVVTRLAQYGGQIVLAWLLEPKAFGLIGMAYSIQAFATLVQQSGIDKVLVAKQDQFDELANPGFWGALATGIVAGGLMFVSAPVAADLLNSPRLTDLILILAIATPFKALWLVPQARLSIDLRYDLQAIINASAIVLQMALTIVLATQGFGAESFVLPALLVNPLVAVILYSLTRPPLHWTPEFAKWPGIAKASGFLIVSAVFGKVISQGDYLIAGAAYSEEVVGIYFMAYSLSVQAIMLLGTNVTATLFPVLSKIRDDEERRRQAFLRIARVSTLFVIPFSVFIAVTAEPVVGLLLDERWASVTPILQIMAVGVSLQVLGRAAWAYLNAQKRFGTIAALQGAKCCVFLGLTVSLVSFGIEWFATGVAAYYLAGELMNTIVVLGFSRRTLKELSNVLHVPLSATLVATSLSLVITLLIPDTIAGYFVHVLAALGFFTLIPIIVAYLFVPSLWSELTLIKSKIWTQLVGE